MNSSSMSIIIIFAELGGFLLLLAVVAAVFYFRKEKKDGGYTKELVASIKKIIPKHRNKLTTHFKESAGLEDAEVKSNVEKLLDKEKKLYENLIKASISKDTSLLKLTVDDINMLVNDYVKMLTLKGNVVANEGKESRELQLRKEAEALRVENISLKKRLEAETETIETMMVELSAMYEGGKKEGEQRVKNEMYKLKQKIDSEEAKVKSEVKKLDLESDENKEESSK